MSTTAQKLTIEAVGTGLLCFTVAVSVGQVAGGHQFAAIAIGSTLMTAIYAGGHISGANCESCVDLAMRPNLPSTDAHTRLACSQTTLLSLSLCSSVACSR